jgi:hypothetical protein
MRRCHRRRHRALLPVSRPLAPADALAIIAAPTRPARWVAAQICCFLGALCGDVTAKWVSVRPPVLLLADCSRPRSMGRESSPRCYSWCGDGRCSLRWCSARRDDAAQYRWCWSPMSRFMLHWCRSLRTPFIPAPGCRMKLRRWSLWV